MKRIWFDRLFALSTASLLAACTHSGDFDDRLTQASGAAIPARRVTVIADGCALEPWQKQNLASDAGRRVIREVVLLCFVPRFDGSVSPADPSAQQALQTEVSTLRNQGYNVRIGVVFTDETGGRYDGKQTAELLGRADYRAKVIAELAARAPLYDGLEVDLQLVPASARNTISTFVEELSAAVRSNNRSLGVFVPPSVTNPSDLPDGEAFDVARISRSVDDLRVMTLDFSCCGAGPGPTIDPGWAVDAVRLAQSRAGGKRISMAYPLYGVDFSTAGERLVTYLEAQGLASLHRPNVERGATGTPHFSYNDPTGLRHDLWYEDSESTFRTLSAWGTDVLPLEVGVVFYGLGAEDPALWRDLARGMP